MSDWLSTGQLQQDEEQQQQQQLEEETTAGKATAEKASADASSGEQKTSTGSSSSSSAARRRKSSYKPRRISPSVPERLASSDAKWPASAVPSSDHTLMQSGNEQRLNNKMIDIQESMMATSEHRAHGGGSGAGKGAATPVDSPNSEYGGIRPEESSSQTGVHSPDGFINSSSGGGGSGGAMDYSDDSHGKIAASSSSAQNDEMKQLTASPKFAVAAADADGSNGGGVVGHVVSQLTKQQFMPSPPQQQQQNNNSNATGNSSITIECKSPPKKPLTTAEQTVQNFYSAAHVQPFTSSPISMVTNFPMMTANPALSSKVSSVMEIAREQLGRTMQQVAHVQHAEKIKKEPQVGRGMVGLGVSTVPMMTDGVQDGVPRYKRPPHTYPALIASAILDSPNRLVTLRGIYDYIMNNFPYYKFCHDKSAWQNSIRHNLSLNQCFIKVPRYENAAKSNYWTMNQEGFEEFGSENSFKRRRRRGQTIPITKGKPSKSKMNGVDQQSSNNNNNDSSNNSQHQDNGGSNSSAPNPANYMFTPAHLMALRGGFWPSAAVATHEQAARDFTAANRLFNQDSNSLQQQQQQNGSNGSDEPAAKVQRMVVLKQGDGPVLSNPTMLMGNPSLSMSTATGAGINPNSSRNPSPAGNGVKTNGIPSSLLTNGNGGGGGGKEGHENSQPIYLDDVKIGNEVTVHQSNGVGDQQQQQQQQTTTSRHYCCQFCSYSYVGPNSVMIESHVKYYHTMEFAALKKALQQQKQLKMLKQQQQHQNSAGDANGAPANSNGTPKSQAMDISSASSDRLASLQSMVGINPQSVFAGLSTQSIIQGLQQAQAAQQQASGIPYTGTFASTLIDDGALRSMVEQQQQQQSMGSGEQQMANNMDAYGAMQRQVLNSAIQQAAGVNPDSLRLIYQQLMQQQQQQQTPLVATNPNPTFQGQLNGGGGNDSNNGSDQQQQQQMPTSQYQHIWQHYQQRLAQHLKSNPLAAAAAAAGGSAAAAAFPTAAAARSTSGEGAGGMNVVGKRASRESPHHNHHHHQHQQQVEHEQERSASPSSGGGKKSGCGDSRGWKKCDQCEFTAKGSHGLETHQRSTHSGSSPGANHHHNNHHHHHQPHDSSSNNENEAALMLLPFGSNKGSNGGDVNAINRHGSGEKAAVTTSSTDAQLLHPSLSSRRKGSSSSSASSSASSSGAKQMKCAETQTEGGSLMSSSSNNSDSNNQECPYCEVTFKDEMMHALHMSCHDKNDPFMCKVCGQHCHEKYYFNVHLLRGLHQNTNNNTTTSTSSGSSSNADGTVSNGSAATGASNGRQNSSEGSTRVSPSPVEIRLSPR